MTTQGDRRCGIREPGPLLQRPSGASPRDGCLRRRGHLQVGTGQGRIATLEHCRHSPPSPRAQVDRHRPGIRRVPRRHPYRLRRVSARLIVEHDANPAGRRVVHPRQLDRVAGRPRQVQRLYTHPKDLPHRHLEAIQHARVKAVQEQYHRSVGRYRSGCRRRCGGWLWG